MRLCLQLFFTYLKIGTFTLGGGYAMLAYVQREIVDKRHWINEEEFLNMMALAQAAPGLLAVNTAIFVGWCVAKAHPIVGCRVMWQKIYIRLCVVAAVLGAVLPSVVIILVIAILFDDYRQLPTVEAIFKGLRPAVVALIVAPLYRLAKSAHLTWKTAVIPALCVVLIAFLHINPIWVIVATFVVTLSITFMINPQEK